ncbi:MAG: hypothetical protein ACJA1C_001967 [Crocinitomicaceae bacterium]|jgi:hypothetical protein
MKRIFTIAVVLMITASGWAQAPEKMSYQAVVRNSSNALVTTQVVGMQISILQGSTSGTPVYVETQTPTTNANGLVSLEIGTGTVVNGDFTTIDWANNTYFIKTETDPTGGTSYTISGTSQLMSVPYALHAKTAESITGVISYTETDPVFLGSIANGITAVDTANWNNHTIDTDTQLDSIGIVTLGFVADGGPSDIFYLGQDTLGGIVYYIHKDATGTQHGLIVNKTESTGFLAWQAAGTATGADYTEDGVYNTALMTGSAAATYVTGLGAGWYLPSIYELGLLYHNGFTTNKALRTGGLTLLSTSNNYWSSTELYTNPTTHAFYFGFLNGSASTVTKSTSARVRAVKAF